MAGNNVQAGSMIIKARKSQPLPSEAFKAFKGANQIPRGEENQDRSVIFGLTCWEPWGGASFPARRFSNQGSRVVTSVPFDVLIFSVFYIIHLYKAPHPCQKVDRPKIGLPVIKIGLPGIKIGSWDQNWIP